MTNSNKEASETIAGLQAYMVGSGIVLVDCIEDMSMFFTEG
jgi:hypothetical protein